MKPSGKPTHIDEVDHLRLQLAGAQQQIAALQAEVVQAKLAAKYGDGVSYDANTLEIKRPADDVTAGAAVDPACAEPPK